MIDDFFNHLKSTTDNNYFEYIFKYPEFLKNKLVDLEISDINNFTFGMRYLLPDSQNKTNELKTDIDKILIIIFKHII